MNRAGAGASRRRAEEGRTPRHVLCSPGRRAGVRGEAGEGTETPQEEEVTVAREEIKLKLGKGADFDKSRLKRLPQEDERGGAVPGQPAVRPAGVYSGGIGGMTITAFYLQMFARPERVVPPPRDGLA